MYKKIVSCFLLVFFTIMTFTNVSIADQSTTETMDLEDEAPEFVNGYEVIQWENLIPVTDLEILETNAPDIDHQSAMGFQMKDPKTIKNEQERKYYEALNSHKVNVALNNKKIRIPGFIVPLSYNDKKEVTEFFLVPMVGACIHVPPPPPNQLVYVTYEKGFKLDSMNDAYWIDGVIYTELHDNDLGSSAYRMVAMGTELYQ